MRTQVIYNPEIEDWQTLCLEYKKRDSCCRWRDVKAFHKCNDTNMCDALKPGKKKKVLRYLRSSLKKIPFIEQYLHPDPCASPRWKGPCKLNERRIHDVWRLPLLTLAISPLGRGQIENVKWGNCVLEAKRGRKKKKIRQWPCSLLQPWGTFCSMMRYIQASRHLRSSDKILAPNEDKLPGSHSSRAH